MFGSTLWLTLATLAGLVAGFAREWLLVAAWGAGSRSDGFLVAVFLPEALRMTLAAGLLAAAALPLYQQRDPHRQQAWLASLSPRLLGVGLALFAILALGAPLWVRLIGPGLDAAAHAQAAANLRWLAACAPGLVMHGLFSIPLQARQRFVLPGLGSLLFNLPPVLYLFIRGSSSDSAELAMSFFAGSVLMCLPLLAPVWSFGWRPWQVTGDPLAGRELLGRIGPLLASNVASQGLALLERLIASFLGEGAVTWVNLARKLINLPLIALMSLNQVLLGMMSGEQGQQRLALLRRGLDAATLLSLPAAFGLIGASPTLIHLLMPAQSVDGPLPALLAWFATPLVFGAWNAMLARYAYASGDTRLPLNCELLGSLVNAALLVVLPYCFGLPGIALAALGGVVVTNVLLMHRQQLLGQLGWPLQWGLSGVLLGVAALALHPLHNDGWQLGLSSLAGALVLVGLGLWLKPWKA
ncbi:murein biosynthesis integral membrane protein MurJ [Pseudomonas sp. PA-1-2A]|uniref:lipid II flippase MurJ n=1 Tax=Pseudomonas TaxID=286 RepID=UPI001BC925F3|nr:MULTISPECIES: lipid II flippase MurJ [Pseudomonas]MBY8954664.1 polysaccharide biosynthesis C-terminal domain-containing protein [Pseudomonas carnis]MCF5692122.1 murein biosynthesis integral membrane protein MurJ [Pseudomonas sp. PA-1-8C]MCF5788208.1 murein biosynthesis integral membrane protein MurJ [Pseudomonas sp. PA-1-6G]MCF5794589.1 murein biosynthesis integral membrane protein MurJ [Pseudomonas sp. PA-1-6B]MCF5796798.1 murein biosynthesis integral membrane protein MurJ [Pseudomonas sp.